MALMTMKETQSKSIEEFVKKVDSQLQGHIAESSKKIESHDSNLDDLGKKLDILIEKIIAP